MEPVGTAVVAGPRGCRSPGDTIRGHRILLELVLGMPPASDFLDKREMGHEAAHVRVSQGFETEAVVRESFLVSRHEEAHRNLVVFSILEDVPNPS